MAKQRPKPPAKSSARTKSTRTKSDAKQPKRVTAKAGQPAAIPPWLKPWPARFGRAWRWLKPRIIGWAKAILPLWAVAMTSPLSEYMKGAVVPNAISIQPGDLRLPLAIGLIEANLIVLIFWAIWPRDRRRALLGGVLVMFYNFNFEKYFQAARPLLNDILPDHVKNLVLLSWVWLGAVVIVAALLVKLLFGLVEIRFKKSANPVYGLVVFVVSFVFASQLLPAANYILATRAQNAYRTPDLASVAVATTAKTKPKPDIYYLIADDYTSAEVMRDYLGYNNSPFLNYLRGEGFYVADNAYSAYPYTSMSVASTLNADYWTEAARRFGQDRYQTNVFYYNQIHNGSVIRAFKQLGYRYEAVGDWAEVADSAPLADQFFDSFGRLHVAGRVVGLSEFEVSTLSRNFLNQSLQAGISVGSHHAVKFDNPDLYSATMDQLKTIRDLADQPAGGRFIFADVLVPHPPYMFKPDGSNAPDSGDDDVGRPNKQKYIEQIEFINTQMHDLITHIKTASKGEAVIVFLSEEGMYPDQQLGGDFDPDLITRNKVDKDMRQWSDDYLRAKYGILAAYYAPKISQATLAAQSNSVNIFRLILNEYFGFNLPYRATCVFGFDQGAAKTLHYVDLSARLIGQAKADPTCHQLQ